jgi:hypothetical protein
MSSSSSTAQYYQESARKMGMVDGQKRVYLIKSIASSSSSPATESGVTPLCSDDNDETPPAEISPRGSIASPSDQPPLLDSGTLTAQDLPAMIARCLPHLSMLQGSGSLSLVMPTVAPNFSVVGLCDASQHDEAQKATSSGAAASILMAQPDDAQHLNALHRFVRKRIEFFSATEQDVASPCPGRKTRVLLGQVGLRCTRCAHLPFVDRVKRAVCFPPSIKGLYHAVSNMKYVRATGIPMGCNMH